MLLSTVNPSTCRVDSVLSLFKDTVLAIISSYLFESVPLSRFPSAYKHAITAIFKKNPLNSTLISTQHPTFQLSFIATLLKTLMACSYCLQLLSSHSLKTPPNRLSFLPLTKDSWLHSKPSLSHYGTWPLSCVRRGWWFPPLLERKHMHGGQLPRRRTPLTVSSWLLFHTPHPNRGLGPVQPASILLLIPSSKSPLLPAYIIATIS